jgi:predicted nucleic acid-binding Zn ribbon protein
MSDPPPQGCEVCGKGPLEKLLYPVAVHFKGSGFYSTDYGRSGRKAAGSKDGESGSSSEGSSSGEKAVPATETKSAAAD